MLRRADLFNAQENIGQLLHLNRSPLLRSIKLITQGSLTDRCVHQKKVTYRAEA